MKIRKWSIVLVMACLGFAPMPSHALPDAGLHVVSLSIAPMAATTVRQGEAFSFEVTLSNSLPLAVSGMVTLELDPPGSAQPASLDAWVGMVPASATTKFERRVFPAKYFAPTGDYAVTATGSFRLQALPTLVIDTPTKTFPFQVSAPVVTAPKWEDVTAAKGITTTLATVNCQNYAAGAAWADVNGDGMLDLFIAQRGSASELWINEGDHFVEQGAQYGVTNRNDDGSFALAAGAVFADYDNDGRPDLLITNDGNNRLLHNDGSSFSDVTAAAGLLADGNHTSAAWGDYDSDGYLDVFVATHGRRPCDRKPFDSFPDHLYHNNGDGTFTDVTDLLPHSGVNMGLTFQPSWIDYNSDGRPDLNIANDQVMKSDQVNMMWRNDGLGSDGKWKFTNVSRSSGAGLALNSMGAAIGDFDRDGTPDLAMSNIGAMVLLKNNGDGTFTNVAPEVGVGEGRQPNGILQITWGLGAYDFNNDGWEDLYLAAGGMMTDDAPLEPNISYVADGTGHFLDLSAPSLANDPYMSRGIAFADFDNDGKMDMFVMDQGQSPRLYHNVTPSSDHWLEVRATTNNRAACGAKLVASFPGQPSMTRWVSCGSTSLASGSDPIVHFGLGSSETIPTLVITWPSGAQQTLTDVTADQVLALTE